MSMKKFAEIHDHLVRDFHEHGIPTDKPGFCDHPNFLAEEKIDADYLDNYAAFIATKPYSPEYLVRARTAIVAAAPMLNRELVKNGRLGACVDISGILQRILEKEGIWSCPIKGSLTIEFPKSSGLATQYFWSADYGNFVAGHAWVFAPPFSIIDVAIKQQSYKPEHVDYIPPLVLSEDLTGVGVVVDDVVSPTYQAYLRKRGIPSSKHLDTAAPKLGEMLKVLPAISVPGLLGAQLKYTPVAVGMPEDPLEEISNMDFSGKTPLELYNEVFRGRIG